jgi:hypothetical protein
MSFAAARRSPTSVHHPSLRLQIPLFLRLTRADVTRTLASPLRSWPCDRSQQRGRSLVMIIEVGKVTEETKGTKFRKEGIPAVAPGNSPIP